MANSRSVLGGIWAVTLYRLLFLTSIAAGWGAFTGWLICELTLFHWGASASWAGTVLIGSIIGGFLGAGVGIGTNLVHGFSLALIRSAGFGSIGGVLGGAIGTVFGSLLYQFGLPRALGWMLLGIGIGACDGLFQRAPVRARNGAIGGAVGGLIGGLVFDPVQAWLHSGTGMSSRATAFVILGLSTGAFLGLSHLVFKRAWLTVLDGYRPGRQLIFDKPSITLGRDDANDLAFLGKQNQQLEPVHVRLEQTSAGNFIIRHLNSKVGTLLNGSPVQGDIGLHDGDLIQIGTNFIRFNAKNVEPSVNTGASGRPTQATTNTSSSSPPPPPPLKRSPTTPQVVPSLPTNTPPSEEVPQSRKSSSQAGPKPESSRMHALPPPPPPPPKRKGS